jgi:hypothetical protein
MAMNNHHTTEDPKNIRMTEQERSTLHTHIMKHVGMPTAQVSPIKVHPSQWLSASVFKPVFLALFLLMISTSGVLLYQERTIKENKKEVTPIENQKEEQVVTEAVDIKTAPTNTAVQQKTFQTPQPDAATMPMLMSAPVAEPITASQKRVVDTRQTGTISGHIRKINPVCMTTDRGTADPECQNTNIQINIIATNNDTGEQYVLRPNEQGEIQDALPFGTYLIEPENKEYGTLRPDEYTVSENSPYQIFTLYK